MTSPSLPPPAGLPPVPGAKKKKSTWPWMLGGCGCLTLLLVGVVALVWFYKTATRNESISKNASAPPTQAMQLPNNYPEDIPIYPGATVELAIPVLAATAPTDYSVTLVARARFQDVVAFYDRELSTNGWTIGKQSDRDGAAARQGLKRPAKVAVTISARKDGTTSIVIGNTTLSANW